MASQPIISFSEPVYRQPKTKVSFAVIAGQGAQAADAAVKTLPPEKQAATLDDLAWRGMTEHLIATAEKLLSPRMYAAFLRWGETASYSSTQCNSDEEGLARCKATSAAVRAVANAPVVNVQDLLFKTFLLSLEVGDCPAFGSVNGGSWDTYLVDDVARGSAGDVLWHSPIASLIDELADKAWKASGPTALDTSIGRQITAAFSYARGVNSAVRGVVLPHDLPAAGYAPYMRGPLIEWERRYDAFVEARADRVAYERDVYLPAAPMTGDPIQERFDDMIEAEADALHRLLIAVAPSSSELAIKLVLVEQYDAHELSGFEDVARQLASDSRRFARHGAHLQTDEAILGAFATYRQQTAEWIVHDDWSHERLQTFDKEIDRSVVAIAESRATTIEGVLVKLRIAFQNRVEGVWGAHAAVDPTHPSFVDGINMADLYDRMLWSGIADLARIGGVNLTEQGA